MCITVQRPNYNIYRYVYIYIYVYIFFLHRYWYSMHALHCITHLWMLTQTCAKQNWICLKTWFFISQNSTKSEGNFLKTTAFQTFKMSRNQSFSAVKSGGTRRRSAARHLHAWCLTDLKLWPPNSPTDKTSHQQKSKWISWICCENCCNHWIFLGINRREHETRILIWNQHQN